MVFFSSKTCHLRSCRPHLQGRSTKTLQPGTHGEGVFRIFESDVLGEFRSEICVVYSIGVCIYKYRWLHLYTIYVYTYYHRLSTTHNTCLSSRIGGGFTCILSLFKNQTHQGCKKRGLYLQRAVQLMSIVFSRCSNHQSSLVNKNHLK